MLEKGNLQGFSLKDHSGRSCCVLTRAQNAEVVADLLLHAARLVSDDLALRISRRRALEFARSRKPRAAELARGFRRLLELSGRHARRSKFGLAFGALVALLEDHFILLAEVTLTNSRSLVKLEYHRPLDGFAFAAGRIWQSPARTAVLDVPAASDAQSYHAEIQLPRELRAETAGLFARDSDSDVLMDFVVDVDQVALLRPEATAHDYTIGVDLTPQRTVDIVGAAVFSLMGTAFACVAAMLLWGDSKVSSSLAVPGALSAFLTSLTTRPSSWLPELCLRPLRRTMTLSVGALAVQAMAVALPLGVGFRNLLLASIAVVLVVNTALALVWISRLASDDPINTTS